MKINQLFKSFVPEGMLLRLLECFGYTNTDLDHLEDVSFCKNDLEKLDTKLRMSALQEEIAKYYLPCKAKIYTLDLDERKCITLLRQVLKLHGYVLVSRQKHIKNEKVTFYSIKKINTISNPNHNTSLRIGQGKTILTFV